MDRNRKYGYIYITTNKINGKIYIGQKHSYKFIESYLGSGHILKEAIDKYGNDNFVTHIISFYESAEELDIAERYWIKKYNSQDKNIGYNISEGGIWGKCEYTKDEKEKISKKLKESIHNFYINESVEHRMKRLAGLKGKGLGRKASKEAREKMSKAAKNRECYNKGKIVVFKNNNIKYINKNEIEYYKSIGYKQGNPKIVKLKDKSFITTYLNLKNDIFNIFGVSPTRTILKHLVRTGEKYHPYQLKFRCLDGLTIKKEVVKNDRTCN